MLCVVGRKTTPPGLSALHTGVQGPVALFAMQIAGQQVSFQAWKVSTEVLLQLALSLRYEGTDPPVV